MKFCNFLSLIFDSVSGFRIPCFTAAQISWFSQHSFKTDKGWHYLRRFFSILSDNRAFIRIGPVELDVHVRQNYGGTRRVLAVDLGSVYKTEDGDAVYWLEKAEVLLRNKWELIIEMGFSSGLTGSVKSRPFRVTTKSQYKMKKKGGL